MAILKERITNLRNRIITRLSYSPFLMSYIILTTPLTLLGIGVLGWPNCGAYYNGVCNDWHAQDWHVHLLAIVFASALQPTGSMLLSPASPHPPLLSRLNPLVCVAEGVPLILTLFNFHFLPTDSPLSYVAAATLILYYREASSLTQPQLEALTSSKTPPYAQTRLTYNFPALTARSIHASTSLYVIGLLALIRLTVNKWYYLNAPVITMLCVHFIWSFGFLFLVIVIDTSRPLTPDEHAVVEEKFRMHLLRHELEQSLGPDSKKARNGCGRKDLDDGWWRLGIFVVAYLGVNVCVLVLWKWVVQGPPRVTRFGYYEPAWPWILFPWRFSNLVVAFPGTLIFCFALMKAGNLSGDKGEVVYWAVTCLVLAVYYTLMWCR